MYIFYCDMIPYFVYKDHDAAIDFIAIADEILSCEHEADAIRRHLLLKVGIV